MILVVYTMKNALNSIIYIYNHVYSIPIQIMYTILHSDLLPGAIRCQGCPPAPEAAIGIQLWPGDALSHVTSTTIEATALEVLFGMFSTCCGCIL